MPDASVHPIRSALGKFWAPVPWMLEAVIVIELALRDYVEAAVIAVLLIFNAALSFLQESHAQATLAALKSRLPLTASVRRDGRWKRVSAAELVAGDTSSLSAVDEAATMDTLCVDRTVSGFGVRPRLHRSPN